MARTLSLILLAKPMLLILLLMVNCTSIYNVDSDCVYYSCASQVANRLDYVAVAAGGYHSLALKRPCQSALVGDLNGDCNVNLADFALFAKLWQQGHCRADNGW